jgi:hypothetical protein
MQLNEESTNIITETAATAEEAVVNIKKVIKENMDNPEVSSEEKIKTLGALVQDNLVAFMAIDEQFSKIALLIESLLRGHNDLVKNYNETVSNPSWLASVVDARIADRENIIMQEQAIIECKNKFKIVSINNDFSTTGDKPNLEIGQILTYIKYPINPEQFTESDLDSFSHNEVYVEEADGLKRITKEENKILFSAASLMLSEIYVQQVQENLTEPKMIKTLDLKDYALLDTCVVLEIPGNSIGDLESVCQKQ